MLKPSSPHRTVHFAIDVDTRRAVVSVSGTLNTAAALAAAESLRSSGSGGPPCVTLDLSEVTHVVPRALHLLEAEVAQLRDDDVPVRVKAPAGSLAHAVLRSECSLLDHDFGARRPGPDA